MIEDFETTNNQRGFEPMGTKVSPAMAQVWNAICESLGTDTYHLLQQFIYAMIRMSSSAHRLTPEVEKLMTLLDTDVAWQRAINLCAPDGKQTISQLILIVEQKGKSGFGMYKIDKPFMGEQVSDGIERTQTENVNIILERVLEIGFQGVYKKLRKMGDELECKYFSDVILTMLDAMDLMNAVESDRREMAGEDIFSDRGRRIEYGKKSKSFHHRTPDGEAMRQLRINFDDFDREIADYEAKGWEGEHHDRADDVERSLGTRPFDVES